MIFNNYRQLGGEETAFINEYEILKKYYNVTKLNFQNSKINFQTARGIITNSNQNSLNALKKIIKVKKIDYFYIGNLWYEASLVLLEHLLSNNYKVVIKLHNYRFDCINGIHFKNNSICHDCNQKNAFIGIVSKCYNNSLLQSVGITIHSKKLFKLLKHKNLKILVLTNFQKNYLINLGIDQNRIYIYENYVAPIFNTGKKELEKYYLSVGRLETEKGFEEIIDVWNKISNRNIKLKIIGSGTQLEKLLILSKGKNIEFLGKMSHDETMKSILNSQLLIFNSKLYEGQPMVLTEASVNGIPSIFPNIGGLKEFFPPNYNLMFEEGQLLETLEASFDIDLNLKGNEVKKFILSKISEKVVAEKFQGILDD